MVVLTIPSEAAYTMRLGRCEGHEWVVRVTYSNFRRPALYAATGAIVFFDLD
jgi:hypothetical protein